MAKENYTTYDKQDFGDKYSVTPTNIDVTGLLRNESAWVVDDKGVDNFDGDFEHLVDIEVSSSTHNALFVPWMLANAVDDWNALLSDAGEDLLVVLPVGTSGTSIVIRLGEAVGASFIFDDYSGAFNTPYYLKPKRDESVGSFGQIQCFIYSDSARTILLDTLSLALRVKNDFRYVYGMNSANNGTTPSITGSASNLDLQEAAPPVEGLVQKIAGIFGVGRLGLR